MRRDRLLHALLLVTVALAAAGCSATTKVVTTGPSADTIAVRGNGTAMSAPDRVRVGFGVEKRDADPRKAMSLVSAASNKVTAALRKAGIADKDLQTGSVRLDAQYRYDRTGAHLDGYLAAISISARSTQLAKAGDIIVAATSAGATRVDGVTFDLDEKNPARYEASADAVRDARERASAMAKAAGRKLGAVVSIGVPEQTGGSSFLRTDGYAVGNGLPGIPEISPGQLKAGETVEVVFALE